MTTWWFAPNLSDPDPARADVRHKVATQAEANLQGSLNEDGTHSIVLDLDCPHEYRPSTTKGHGHLVIPARLSTDTYGKLLQLLEITGVITSGYLGHASKRGWQTFVRAPGVVKPEGASSSDSAPEERQLPVDPDERYREGLRNMIQELVNG